MRPTPAVTILGTALTLGFLGDWLLRGTPWGLNVVLWGTGLAAAAAAHSRLRAGQWRTSTVTGLVLGVASLGAFLWRDAEFLQFWGVIALLVSLTLVTADATGVNLPTMRVADGPLAALECGLRALAQPVVLLTRDVPWAALAPKGPWRHGPAVAVGVLLAVPIVFVFGALLRSADPVFAQLIDHLLGWDLSRLASHLVVIVALTWVTAGFLHGIVLAQRRLVALPDTMGLPRLGLVQVGIPLGALVVLLATFAIIQAEYLFGGIATVLETAGLTLAEYARRGFFELVTITALVLAVLWIAHALLDHAGPKSRRGYRMFALPLLLLVGVVLVSALVRLRLYVEHFGLSENRVYATAFMAWLAALLAWFAATTLRDRPDRFAFGAVLAGFVTLLALTTLNPHALIARTNLARAAQGEELDARYLAHLGADAVPAVVAAWSTLDTDAQCVLWERMIKPWKEPGSDWRSWNVGRKRAMDAVATLGGAACQAEKQDAG